jgi:anti-anti-sigma factor
MDFKTEITDNFIIYEISAQMSVMNLDLIEKLIADIKKHSNYITKSFVWDFSNVPFIDSTGLSVIALTVAHSIKNGSYVNICGADEDMKYLFKKSRMDRNVKYYDYVEEIIDVSEASPVNYSGTDNLIESYNQ